MEQTATTINTFVPCLPLFYKFESTYVNPPWLHHLMPV